MLTILHIYILIKISDFFALSLLLASLSEKHFLLACVGQMKKINPLYAIKNKLCELCGTSD